MSIAEKIESLKNRVEGTIVEINETECSLDGFFSLEELREIADLMDEMGR
jgi:hypothetical protein